MKKIYACEDHIDEAMDEVIDGKETFPVINKTTKKYNTISKRNQRIIYKNKCSTRRTRSKQTKFRRRNK
jgi:CxxH/CxxC protein (TIGR04129 family)